MNSDQSPADRPHDKLIRYCGDCLMLRHQNVELDKNGICPKCGKDYGPHPQETMD